MGILSTLRVLATLLAAGLFAVAAPVVCAGSPGLDDGARASVWHGAGESSGGTGGTSYGAAASGYSTAPDTPAYSLASAGLLSRPLATGHRDPDLVVVEKSEKTLYLLRAGRVVKAFPIALGKNPVGHKYEAGDGKTPEGRYTLDWRNPESKYYRSIHISYPNQQDLALAEANNRNPGEAIMIHGTPAWVPSSEWAKNWLNKEDWTEGCIAVANDDMDEIWNLVKDGTPIEIRP